MKIHLVGGHKYPARLGGVAGARVADCLAKGLAELGHQVSYELPYAPVEPLPDGVQLVHERRFDVDIMWINGFEVGRFPMTRGIPWLRTVHAPDKSWARHARNNWIFLSASHAAFFGRDRYVRNGIDPGEFCYGEPKDDYFLFMVADLSQLQLKGFQIARELVRRCGIRLVVAGAISENAMAEHYERMFAEDGVDYVGHVSGWAKAELLSGARALLFPTQADETFGLVVAEALMSGTPVICSDRGACRELVPPEFGFVCSNFDEYASALRQAQTISPLACRVFALEHYHYLRMARNYLAEFEQEIVRWRCPAYRATLGQCSRWVSFELRGRRFAVGIPDRKHFQAV
jgi:glycosyltransferase involved in cell wall biosynthesis